jgi:hypothetical protein
MATIEPSDQVVSPNAGLNESERSPIPSRPAGVRRVASLVFIVATALSIILLVGPPEGATETSSMLSRAPIQFAYTYRGGRVESTIADCERKGCGGQGTFQVYVPIYDFLRSGLEQGYYYVRIGIYPGIPWATQPGQTARVFFNGSLISTLTFAEQTVDGHFAPGEQYVVRYSVQPDQPGWDMIFLTCPGNMVREENIISVVQSSSIRWDPAAAVILITPRTDFAPWWKGHMQIVMLIAVVTVSGFTCFMLAWNRLMTYDKPVHRVKTKVL